MYFMYVCVVLVKPFQLQPFNKPIIWLYSLSVCHVIILHVCLQPFNVMFLSLRCDICCRHVSLLSIHFLYWHSSQVPCSLVIFLCIFSDCREFQHLYNCFTRFTRALQYKTWLAVNAVNVKSVTEAEPFDDFNVLLHWTANAITSLRVYVV